MIHNLREKFEDLFQRHESSLNLIDELKDKIYIMEKNKTERSFNKLNYANLDINYLDISEYENFDVINNSEKMNNIKKVIYLIK